MGRCVTLVGAMLALIAAPAGGEEYHAPSEAVKAYDAARKAYQEGRVDDARVACRKIIREHRKYRDPYLLLATALRDAGRIAEEAEVYQALLEGRPGEVDARLKRAYLLLWDLGNQGDAREEFLSVRALAKPDSALWKAAEEGLAEVQKQRRRRNLLLRHRKLLEERLLLVVGAWVVLLVIAYAGVRAKRPAAAGGAPLDQPGPGR